MTKTKIKKISINELRNMKLMGFKELIPYTHVNPLVRYVFWKRLEKMLELAEKENKSRVLDFGAGSGIFMPSLSNEFKNVNCIDLKLESLNYVKNKFNLKNIEINKAKKDSVKLPYPDNFFDVIFAPDVLEHFRNSSQIQKEFKRVLKKGGVLIVSGPTENLIYRLCRRIFFRYKKPKDHYTDIYKIKDISNKLFSIERKIIIPFRFFPGFVLYRARKI